MIETEVLAGFLEDELALASFSDYAPNGIQVEGKKTISRICTAVTASLDTIHQAIESKADALIVHHGYFWQGEALPITGMKHRRIRELLMHDINLFAYHLPLDAHLTLGNNACIGRLLNVQNISTQPIGKNPNLLWYGSFENPIAFDSLQDQMKSIFNARIDSVRANEKNIVKIAWCSGAAQDYIGMAKALDVDAFITGEFSERTYYQAMELNINFFACGHHASERFGVQALGDFLRARFLLTHIFLDSPNPF